MAQSGKIYLNRITIEPSIAFEFIDDFTGRKIVDVKLAIENGIVDKKPVKTPGGCYLFYGLPKNMNFSFRAEGKGFETWVEQMEIPDMAPEEPKTIILKPAPSYNFPPGATVLRGMVHIEEQGNPHSIRLSLKKTESLTTKTSDNGEFVFYLKHGSNSMSEIDDCWYVGGPDNSNPNYLSVEILNVNQSDYRISKTVPSEAKKNDSTFVWKIGQELKINITSEKE